MSIEYKYYSIVLKHCANREKLAGRLETILLRGRFAIKMALDTIPSVIVYKGNVTTIIPVVKAFLTEYAAITVVADGVPPALPIAKKYRNFSQLPPQLQTLLSAVPETLWLGEAIHRIVPAGFLDEQGALVVSSHALYFIDQPAGDPLCRWLIIPYEQLTAPLSLITQTSQLSLSYQNEAGQQQDSFSLEPSLLAATQAAIEQAKSAGRYLTKIKTHCLECGYLSEDVLAQAADATSCPHCQQPLERSLLA